MLKNVLPIGVKSIGLATVLASVGGFALFNTANFGKASSQHNNFLSQQPQLCRIIDPPESTKLPEIRHQPYREVRRF